VSYSLQTLSLVEIFISTNLHRVAFSPHPASLNPHTML
jgi:hypothetical protein